MKEPTKEVRACPRGAKGRRHVCGHSWSRFKYSTNTQSHGGCQAEAEMCVSVSVLAADRPKHVSDTGSGSGARRSVQHKVVIKVSTVRTYNNKKSNIYIIVIKGLITIFFKIRTFFLSQWTRK